MGNSVLVTSLDRPSDHAPMRTKRCGDAPLRAGLQHPTEVARPILTQLWTVSALLSHMSIANHQQTLRRIKATQGYRVTLTLTLARQTMRDPSSIRRHIGSRRSWLLTLSFHHPRIAINQIHHSRKAQLTSTRITTFSTAMRPGRQRFNNMHMIKLAETRWTIMLQPSVLPPTIDFNAQLSM